MPKTILVNTACPCCYSSPKLIEHTLQSAFVISYIEPAHPHLRKMVSLPLVFTPMQDDKHETTSRRFTLPPHQQESTYTSQSGYPMGIYPLKCINLLDEVSWSLTVFYLKSVYQAFIGASLSEPHIDVQYVRHVSMSVCLQG